MTSNKFSKTFTTLLVLFCLLTSMSVSILRAETYEDINSKVEGLLDELSRVDSHQSAELIRQKIWLVWLNHHKTDEIRKKFDLGLSYFERNLLKEANNVFSEIILLDSNHVEALNKRATIRYLFGDLNGSLADIREVLLRQKRHFGALAGSGMIYIELKDYNKALQVYRKLLEIDPWNTHALGLVARLEEHISGTIL